MQSAEAAVLEAVQYKVVEEGRASLRKSGGVWLLEYPQALSWSQPCAFEFKHEFQAFSGDLSGLLEQAGKLGNLSRAHVFEIFDPHVIKRLAEFRRHGYELAYRARILKKSIPCETIASSRRLERVAIKARGVEVGSGVIVMSGPRVAVFSDMEVLPRFQRQGHGTQLLNELIKTAKNWGAQEVLLVPSEWATRILFYEKQGFSECGAFGVFYRKAQAKGKLSRI